MRLCVHVAISLILEVVFQYVSVNLSPLEREISASIVDLIAAAQIDKGKASKLYGKNLQPECEPSNLGVLSLTLRRTLITHTQRCCIIMPH